MAKHICDREYEVLECATNGVAGREVRDHIAACSSCREIYETAKAIVEDRAALMRTAPVPSAGLVWWRANMRARREAARAAVRTGSMIQLALLIAAIVAGLAVVGAAIDVHSLARSIATAAHTFAIPVIAFAAWAILAPVALYLVLARDEMTAR